MTLQIAIGDAMHNGHATPRDLVQSIVDETNQRWAKRGIAGAQILSASWQNDSCSICTEPGAEALTVDAVSDFIRESRRTGAA